MPGIEWMVLYMLLGSFAGFMAGLLGVGGGGIIVPLLATIFIQQGMAVEKVVHMALATALACMVISSTSSIRAHAARGNVVWKAFYGMTPGIMLGAFATTRIASHVNSSYIALFFAFFMAFIAVMMFLNWQPKTSGTPVTPRGLFIVGTGIGAVSALAAVGGGFLAVTYLNYKSTLMKKSIGTSAAIGFPIAIAGTVGYALSGWSKTQADPFMFGFIYLPAFAAIAITSLIAAPYGARLAHRLPDARLKKIFALITLALSIKMLVSVL